MLHLGHLTAVLVGVRLDLLLQSLRLLREPLYGLLGPIDLSEGGFPHRKGLLCVALGLLGRGLVPVELLVGGAQFAVQPLHGGGCLALLVVGGFRAAAQFLGALLQLLDFGGQRLPLGLCGSPGAVSFLAGALGGLGGLALALGLGEGLF